MHSLLVEKNELFQNAISKCQNASSNPFQRLRVNFDILPFKGILYIDVGLSHFHSIRKFLLIKGAHYMNLRWEGHKLLLLGFLAIIAILMRLVVLDKLLLKLKG